MRVSLVLTVAICVGPVPEASSVEHERRVLKSPSGYQTVSMLDGGQTGLYYDVGELIGRVRPEAERVVLLGLGGGEMLRAARRTLPRADLIGVELDPRVARAAREEFHVGYFGVDVVVEDAATYIDRAEPGSVDGLMVDVFDDMSIPAYFQSPVFFRSCRRALSPRGLLVMNVYPPELGQPISMAMVAAGFSSVKAQPIGPNLILVVER